MKRFRFRLETVLQLRSRREDELKLSLAGKQREVIETRRAIAALGEELKQMQEEQRARRASESDIAALRHSVSYRNRLKLDMLARGAQLEEQRKEADKIRSQLTQATKDRRIVEILKEKRHAEWKKEYASQEQKTIDDVSQVRSARRRAAASGRDQG